ncbi:MAG: branched-chain amino acid ABC transporter permease [Actinomycetota bacterium]
MEGRSLTRRIVAAGMVGGVVLIYLAAVGMIEKFDPRNLIKDIVTLSRVMLGVPPFFAAYLALRPRLRRGAMEEIRPAQAVVGGAAIGFLSSGLLTAGIAFWYLFNPLTVREIFVSLSEDLIQIMTFNQGLIGGSIILLVGGTLLGAAGGAMRMMPERYRRPLWTGLGTTFLFALIQRIIPTALHQLGLATDWLYSPIFGGLTIVGAIAVFVISTALAWLWRERRDRVRTQIKELSPAQRKSLNRGGAVILVVLAALLPQLLGSVLSQILGTVGIYVLMGLGLNIVVGYAGLLDLGYVAFFAVGAYMAAILTGATLVTSLGANASPAFHLNLTFYAALPLVIMAAAFIGLLIGAPVLRLRGDYLAIVTLGFGEIVRLLITSDALRHFVGGAQGVRDVTDAHIGSFGFRDPQHFFYLVLALVVIAIFVSYRLSNSRVGRAWNAMREDEQVAEAMGISTIRYKLLAFAMGGAIGCLSGALFSVQIGSLNVRSFNILVSITALAVVILGGMGSIPGVIVGAMALIGIPALLSEFEEFKLLIYGGVLVAIMILRPQGLIPNVRRAQELTDEERLQDQWAKQAQPGSEPPTVAVGSTETP